MTSMGEIMSNVSFGRCKNDNKFNCIKPQRKNILLLDHNQFTPCLSKLDLNHLIEFVEMYNKANFHFRRIEPYINSYH